MSQHANDDKSMFANTLAVLSPQHRNRSGFVNRFKIQRERNKSLNDHDSTSKIYKRTLPKIRNSLSEPEPTMVTSMTRSTTVDHIKLPVVAGRPTRPGRRKDSITSIRSLPLRAIPGLPSIPGSPSLLELPASPVGEEPPPPQVIKARLQPFDTKHRFQQIAFQKQIHLDKRELTAPSFDDTHKSIYRLDDRYVQPDPRVTGVDVKLELNLQDRGAHRYQHSQHHHRLETKSDGFLTLRQKWKDNCDCLRCQMLRRQFDEGDELYSMWGYYPCHKLDPMNLLEDDDDDDD